MWSKVKRAFRSLYTVFLGLVIGILASLFILGFVASAALFAKITSLPLWVGKKVPADDWAECFLTRFVNVGEMLEFRDDILDIFREHHNLEPDLRRPELLREIEDAVNQCEDNLRNGEFVITILTGFASVGIGAYATVEIIAAWVTIFAIGISISVLIRVVITKRLAFTAEDSESEKLPELVVRMGWNKGPINGTGGVLIAIFALFIGTSGLGYQIGLDIIEANIK